MSDRSEQFGELAMHLHDQDGVLATVEGVLQFAVEALHYDHASVMLMNRKLIERRADGTSERLVGGDEELLEVLAGCFGLHFPAGTRFAFQEA